jgi:hypothetical protein
MVMLVGVDAAVPAMLRRFVPMPVRIVTVCSMRVAVATHSTAVSGQILALRSCCDLAASSAAVSSLQTKGEQRAMACDGLVMGVCWCVIRRARDR